jgi:mRNA-degrading endonuclease toxin of MazEF toxin-antitoxin module
LSLDNLATIPKAMLTSRITRLSESRLAELYEALRVATGC